MPPTKDKKKETGGSNIVAMFEQNQIQEFKEAFTIMDQNRDGRLNVGNDDEGVFRIPQRHIIPKKNSKETDPEETSLNAFKVFDPEGTGVLMGEEIKYQLMSQADKFTEDEVNQMFTNFPLDVAGNLDYKNLRCVITHGEDKEQE